MRLGLIQLLLILVLLYLSSNIIPNVSCTHFAYGTISWRASDPVNKPHRYRIDLESAWRTSFKWSTGRPQLHRETHAGPMKMVEQLPGGGIGRTALADTNLMVT